MRLFSQILFAVILLVVLGALPAEAVGEVKGSQVPGLKGKHKGGISEARAKEKIKKLYGNEQAEGIRIQQIIHKGMPHTKPTNPVLKEEGPPGACPQKRDTPQAPEHVYKMTNPLKPTPDNLRAGEALFNIDAQPTACKVCHGFGGDGMGIIFERLTPKPRNFTCYYTMDDIPDGQIYWIIKNGSPGTPMPSFGYLSDKEVWQLVLHIREFANRKQ